MSFSLYSTKQFTKYCQRIIYTESQGAGQDMQDSGSDDTIYSLEASISLKYLGAWNNKFIFLTIPVWVGFSDILNQVLTDTILCKWLLNICLNARLKNAGEGHKQWPTLPDIFLLVRNLYCFAEFQWPPFTWNIIQIMLLRL